MIVQPFLRDVPSQQWILRENRIQTSLDPEIVISIQEKTPKVHSPCQTAEYSGEAGQQWTFEHWSVLSCRLRLKLLLSLNGKLPRETRQFFIQIVKILFEL